MVASRAEGRHRPARKKRSQRRKGHRPGSLIGNRRGGAMLSFKFPGRVRRPSSSPAQDFPKCLGDAGSHSVVGPGSGEHYDCVCAFWDRNPYDAASDRRAESKTAETARCSRLVDQRSSALETGGGQGRFPSFEAIRLRRLQRRQWGTAVTRQAPSRAGRLFFRRSTPGRASDGTKCVDRAAPSGMLARDRGFGARHRAPLCEERHPLAASCCEVTNDTNRAGTVRWAGK